MSNNNDSDSDYDTQNLSNIEIIEYKNTRNKQEEKGKKRWVQKAISGFYDQNYKPKNDFISAYKGYAQTEKRLLCLSIAGDKQCNYGSHCNYAHKLKEQFIDIERLFSFQIIFDKNQMNFYSLENSKTDDIYKQLLLFANICDKCQPTAGQESKCAGGFNCRYGANLQCLKLCKNDLLTGGCLNKIIPIAIDPVIWEKWVTLIKPVIIMVV